MKCRKCRAEIPEGKIYCEVCGTAIQMVPDYNPVDDISIQTDDENSIENAAEKSVEQPEEDPAEELSSVSWYNRWRYRILLLVFLVAGLAAFLVAYHAVSGTDETPDETPEIAFLEKPGFSLAPGTYDYSPVLMLSHPERNNGVIYYTTDGTSPTESSPAYDRPITLGEGRTVIRAIFIRSDGVQSEEADGTYEVVYDYPDEPVFSVRAGEYEAGFYVTISADDDCKIYYTTDGTEPDRYSNLYQRAIYVSPGLTVLQAIAIDDDGGESGIVEAIYKVYEDPTPEEEPESNIVEEEEIIP